ncbi:MULTISPECIES: alpha-amylase family glycosyl hydrolase [Nostoc]|uniref:Alpha-amylase n=1 Tax=Nostoc paludosum FACHB-159 TaxID=2692908 RepID=A0ABR8KJC2_9NOSO|nr:MULTISPECIES: alpha-amylase family glycosyl hydrolase [Nostoc]MBD2682844.1 alpha-amylase [Nostoc sp. FACHB-857]MBD2739180.1 alpha-amylase [Nostoc paludosum FACHB-159]
MAKVEELIPQQVSQIDLKPRGRVQLSPVSWRDQFLYYLLPDRFSDAHENERELFDRTNPLRYKVKDKATWMAAGRKSAGGTLRGIRSKLDYLQRLGVTALWIGPVYDYSSQNLLDIDPRFGNRRDLRDLIDAAHDRNIYVILDVIYNHHIHAIADLIKVYEYWIAISDCDGFRVDVDKHISPQDSHIFSTAIHEYAQSIGKDNFLIIGDITCGGIADAYVDFFGRNLNAVVDNANIPKQLTAVVKGLVNPNEFFGEYDENHFAGQYRQLGQYHVSVLDNYDISSHNWKQRFAAYSNVPHLYEQVAHVVGVQLTTPGIPSIYYGTEQAFDGNEGEHDYSIENGRVAEDRYIKEAMFGSDFGAFQTAGCHFFDIDHPTYLRIAAIARIRNGRDKIGKALRRGHHYLRKTSFCNYPFSIPPQGELVAWSQVLFNTEVLMALNTHALEERGAEVTVDAHLHPTNSTMTFLYKSNWKDTDLRTPPRDQTVTVQHHQDGRASVRLDLPPSGMAILA